MSCGARCLYAPRTGRSREMQGNLRILSPSYSLSRSENFQPLRVTSLDTESALNITHKVSVLVELNSRGAGGGD